MHGLSGDGASVASEGYGTQNRIFAVNSPVTNADVYCVSVIDILDYANTNKNTTVRTLQGRDTNGSGILALNSGAWYNTAAVTSITLAARVYNPTSISSFALYGIKGDNITMAQQETHTSNRYADSRRLPHRQLPFLASQVLILIWVIADVCRNEATQY
jgi:hypothetical protein